MGLCYRSRADARRDGHLCSAQRIPDRQEVGSVSGGSVYRGDVCQCRSRGAIGKGVVVVGDWQKELRYLSGTSVYHMDILMYNA